jgi:hypothetical protein
MFSGHRQSPRNLEITKPVLGRTRVTKRCPQDVSFKILASRLAVFGMEGLRFHELLLRIRFRVFALSWQRAVALPSHRSRLNVLSVGSAACHQAVRLRILAFPFENVKKAVLRDAEDGVALTCTRDLP